MNIILVIDAVWSVVALIGIGVSTWALIDCYLDRRAQRQSGLNGMQRMIVAINLRSAAASLWLHTFFLILGIIAFTATVRPRPTLFYILVAIGYILVAATNVRAVGLNQLDRWRLRTGS